jgi:uncharacterized protein (DUF3820 family)
MANLTDESLMPFGIHKDKKLEDVPADYLLWLYKDNKCGKSGLKEYIEENMDFLELEAKQNNRNNFNKD